MKKTFLLSLSLLALSATAQKYTVSGVAPDGVKTVYFYNLESARDAEPDSTEVKDGKFSFSGDANGKIFAMVYAKNNDARPYVVLDGDVTVDLTTNTVKGSAENVAFDAAQKRQRVFLDEMRAVSAEGRRLYEANGNVPDSVAQQLYARQEKAYDGMIADVKKTCDEGAAYNYPAVFLRQFYSSLEKDDVLRYVDGNSKFMQTSYAAPIKNATEGWRRQVVGVMFTDLEEADTAGVSHKLSEYVGKGNYVLIDFWASWCGPCMKEMPNVKALYDKYHAKGFDVVGLSFDSNKDAWVGAINRLQIGWHHLSDLQGWQSLAGQTYGVNAIPATLLIGPDGKVVANGLRGDKLAAKLAEIYGE